MTPFERIYEYEKLIHGKLRNPNANLDDTITYERHYNILLNLLKLLKTDLRNSEYSYVLRDDDKDIEYRSYEDITFKGTHLGKEVMILQQSLREDAKMADMKDLAEVLKRLQDNGVITEDVLVIPSGIDMLKARLVDDVDKDYDEIDSIMAELENEIINFK